MNSAAVETQNLLSDSFKEESERYARLREQTTGLANFVRGTGHAKLITVVLLAFSITCFLLLVLYFTDLIPGWVLTIIVALSGLLSGILGGATWTHINKKD